MSGKAQLKMLLLIVALILIGSGLAACQGGTENDVLPFINDPDMEINVTPEPNPGKFKKVHFTIKINRIGSHLKVGWWAKGEVYASVSVSTGNELVDLDNLPQVSGTGFGMAGYDASGGPCINLGGWPVNYEVGGYFNPESCELTIGIVETWPKTEAHAVCLGYGAEVEGPPYTIAFTGLKFTETDVVKGVPLTQDEIVWVNTFTLIPGMGTENLDCIFADPPAEDAEN